MGLKRSFMGLLVVTLALGGLASGTASASAKVKPARVVKTTKVSAKAYHATKGKIYRTAKLTKVVHNAKNYQHTTFMVTKHATIRKANHKKAIYYYIGKGKAKGWIWRGYLTVGKASKKVTPKTVKQTAKFVADKQSQNFLAVVNQERAKLGVAPLTLNDKLTNLANQRAKDDGAINGLSHTDAQGQLMFDKEAADFGVTGESRWSECLYASGYTSLDFNFGKDAADQYLYHDAASDWGHRKNLIDSDATQIGIGWYVKSSTKIVYNAIDQTN
ncbi:CAP domain-containing protein [Levilactobacillus angrenensis]|uniref:CAP domain-containing protein n=1 Tax=Levilactobacillus angrenensis TaxID=2486020 RepID=A0ABW1UAG5_9LACO|nr:CAP domain-containing protein [Levilactobacillus angrenensis]